MFKFDKNGFGRRDFLKGSALALAGVGFLGRAAETPSLAAPLLQTCDSGTHNMLVVGEKTVFLSHLPMFRDQADDGTLVTTPHRFQAIFEATFTGTGNNAQAQAAYFTDRRQHQATKMYTLNPMQEFVLASLVAPRTRRPFKGRVFRGHQERPGHVAILNGVDVTVKNVIYFREFDANATRPDKLEYLIFGKGDELFMAHLLAASPDFDQIVSVQLTDQKLTDEQLAKGVRVVLADRGNSATSRIKEGQQAAGEINVGGTAKKLQVKVLREFYFEEGELRVPFSMDSTAEERSAGFP
jgi:hypothetical protein